MATTEPAWIAGLRPVVSLKKDAIASRVAVAFVFGTEIVAIDGACAALFMFEKANVVASSGVPPDTPVHDFRSSSGAPTTTFGKLGGVSLMTAPILSGAGRPGSEAAAAYVTAYRAGIIAVVASDVFYSRSAPWDVFRIGERICRRLLGRGRDVGMWYDESVDAADADADAAADAADAARKARGPQPSEVDLLAGERIAAILAAPVRLPQEDASGRPIVLRTGTVPDGLDQETAQAFGYLSERDRARVIAAGARLQNDIRAAFVEFVSARPGLIHDYLTEGLGLAVVDRAAMARSVAAITAKVRRRSWELMSASAPHPDSFDAAVLEAVRRRVGLSPAAFAARGTPAAPIVEASIRGRAGALVPSPEVAICNAVYSADAGEADVVATCLPLCMREEPLGASKLAVFCEFTGGVLPLLDLSRTALTGSVMALLAESELYIRLRACAYSAHPLGPAPGEWVMYDTIVQRHCDSVDSMIYEIFDNNEPLQNLRQPVPEYIRLIIRAREIFARLDYLRALDFSHDRLESPSEPEDSDRSGVGFEVVGSDEDSDGSDEGEAEGSDEAEGASGDEAEGGGRGWTEGEDQGWREAEGEGQGWRLQSSRSPQGSRGSRVSQSSAPENIEEMSVPQLVASLNAVVAQLLDRMLRIEDGALVAYSADSEIEEYRAALAERAGADVDLAVAADDDDEFDRIAALHVESIRRKFPDAPARRAEQGGGRHKWVVETPVRDFEIYRAPLDRVVTHHVAPARAAYTAQPLPGSPAPQNPRLLVSTSYANTCAPAGRIATRRRPGDLREIRSWASRRSSPIEILAKYEARGFKTGSAWAGLLAKAAYAPDARYLHAHAAIASLKRRGWGRLRAAIRLTTAAFTAPVRGAGEWVTGGLKFED